MDYMTAQIQDDPYGFIGATLNSNKLGILIITGKDIPLEFYSLASNPSIKKHAWFGFWKGETSKDFRKEHHLSYPSLIGFYGLKENPSQFEYSEFKGKHTDLGKLQFWALEQIQKV